jgi:leucyl-tRNA synthetase
MAVPCGDEEIMLCEARQNGMPAIKNIFNQDISSKRLMERKKVFNWSIQILNGLDYKKGTLKVIEESEK